MKQETVELLEFAETLRKELEKACRTLRGSEADGAIHAGHVALLESVSTVGRAICIEVSALRAAIEADSGR